MTGAAMFVTSTGIYVTRAETNELFDQVGQTFLSVNRMIERDGKIHAEEEALLRMGPPFLTVARWVVANGKTWAGRNACPICFGALNFGLWIFGPKCHDLLNSLQLNKPAQLGYHHAFFALKTARKRRAITHLILTFHVIPDLAIGAFTIPAEISVRNSVDR